MLIRTKDIDDFNLWINTDQIILAESRPGSIWRLRFSEGTWMDVMGLDPDNMIRLADDCIKVVERGRER